MQQGEWWLVIFKGRLRQKLKAASQSQSHSSKQMSTKNSFPQPAVQATGGEAGGSQRYNCCSRCSGYRCRGCRCSGGCEGGSRARAGGGDGGLRDCCCSGCDGWVSSRAGHSHWGSRHLSISAASGDNSANLSFWEIMQRKWRKTLSSHQLFGIYWEVISSMIVVILSTLNGTLEFGSIEPRSTSWIAVIYTNRHEKIPSVILFGKIWTPCPLGVKCIDNRLGEWLDLYQGQVTEVVVWVVCVLVTLVAVDVIDEVTLVKVTWHWATHFPPTEKLQDFVQFPPNPPKLSQFPTVTVAVTEVVVMVVTSARHGIGGCHRLGHRTNNRCSKCVLCRCQCVHRSSWAASLTNHTVLKSSVLQVKYTLAASSPLWKVIFSAVWLGHPVS